MSAVSDASYSKRKMAAISENFNDVTQICVLVIYLIRMVFPFYFVIFHFPGTDQTDLRIFARFLV